MYTNNKAIPPGKLNKLHPRVRISPLTKPHPIEKKKGEVQAILMFTQNYNPEIKPS